MSLMWHPVPQHSMRKGLKEARRQAAPPATQRPLSPPSTPSTPSTPAPTQPLLNTLNPNAHTQPSTSTTRRDPQIFRADPDGLARPTTDTNGHFILDLSERPYCAAVL